MQVNACETPGSLMKGMGNEEVKGLPRWMKAEGLIIEFRWFSRETDDHHNNMALAAVHSAP